ncbi:RNA polymerase sigma-70 factor, ECF subfamily [Granulicella pectinivorans]|jgi:RNA polymerase sigma-70 factor (ECF subfamily)|uniref:RNA polymerase sigma factor n=1 Tax=Granulicella pectinivorans TaxID=474950 RepID=A0A1I6M3T8_9BACT|nr:sigma-70 family RNA polymerase sigma factor [Granulicella pectinivorans]SFS10323.1 RNA polymerase sigma-70 factor, ECF subfamily [Granulicella pectinivorans]
MPETTLNTLLDHRSQFLGFVRRRVENPALAEDILQSAYIRALQSESAPPEESVVAWFYRILRNAVIDHYRRRATESKALETFAHELESTPTVELHDEVCACLTSVLDALTPSYADLLRSVDLNEQPLQQYAHSHNITPANAAVRAHRARAALRKQLLLTCGACAEHACLECTCRR